MDKLAAMLASLLLAFAAQCSPPAAIPVYRDYTPMAELKGVADAYACPTLFDWDGDGLLDLVVGEITTNCTGKARLYLNRGTAKEARFDDYSYLQKDGKDIEFSAKGCVGLQIGFGKAGDITMFLSTSNGKIYGWNPSSRKPGADEQIDFVTWFDHSTDERFSRLIRSCTFCADIDGDGCDDLVVSGQNSPIFWVKRSGSG